VTPEVGANNTAPRVVVDWGDGSTTDLGFVPAARTVVHTYLKAGFYTITATAVSDGGDTSSTSTFVTVTAQPPIGLAITASPTTPRVNDTVTFTANITGDLNAIVKSYTFTISGGSGSENATITQTSNQLTRAFTTVGLKTISVTALTSDDRMATGSTQISVQAALP